MNSIKALATVGLLVVGCSVFAMEQTLLRQLHATISEFEMELAECARMNAGMSAAGMPAPAPQQQPQYAQRFGRSGPELVSTSRGNNEVSQECRFGRSGPQVPVNPFVMANALMALRQEIIGNKLALLRKEISALKTELAESQEETATSEQPCQGLLKAKL